MIQVRRWSDHVVALYVPDGLFGRLLRIVDTRETVATPGFAHEWERLFGYDDGADDGSALTPRRPESSPSVQPGQEQPPLNVPKPRTRRERGS